MSESGQQYCGDCFALFARDDSRCPLCGAETAALTYRDYQQKLVHALEHPLADVRMRAIIALGLRGELGAVDALVDCALRHPIDVVEGLEIVRSLESILGGHLNQEAMQRLIAEHPGHAIQMAAIQALSRLT